MTVAIAIVAGVLKTIDAVALSEVQVWDEVCGRPSVGGIVEYSAIPLQWTSMADTDVKHALHSMKREGSQIALPSIIPARDWAFKK